MCLIGVEVLSVLGHLLDMEVISDGEGIHMANNRIFSCSGLIGAVHLLCIHSFLRGNFILGRHTQHGQEVIFSQSGCQQVIFGQSGCHQGLCIEDNDIKK